MKSIQASALGLLLAISGLTIAAFGQQSYVFTKVLDNLTQRPDGGGPFNITTPAFDGQWVVLRDAGVRDDGSLSAIWSFNTLDGTFHKLVDWNTRTPGSTATFHDFQISDTAPVIRNGTVIFVARDSSTNQNPEGLYSVPAAGGPVLRIADYRTADPSGGTFNVFDLAGKQTGAFSFDGTTVAFNAQGSALTLGNYSAKPDGSSLALVADNLHPYAAQGASVAAFSTPAIDGSNVVMIGTDGVASGAGYNGLYLGSVGGNGAVTELLNSRQPLPGNPNANFHTRFNAPALALDGTLVAFRADDLNSGNGLGFFGLYSTDLTSHTVRKIEDLNSSLTGLGTLSSLAAGGVSVSQGGVLYRAADLVGAYPGHSALYVWKNGVSTRVVGTGDQLNGQTVQFVAEPGSGALSGPNLVFLTQFSPSGWAVYVAALTPNPVSPTSVNNSASYAFSSIAPGELVALFGSGLGPAVPAHYTLDANNRIPTSLAGVQVLFNGAAAPVIYASDKQINSIVPFELAGQSTAQVVVQYNVQTSAPIAVPVTNTMPGLFSADLSGSGQGAIHNADLTYNSPTNPAPPGSTVVLWATGLGALLPGQPNGSIVGGSSLPVLNYPVTVKIGGQTAQIAYQGPAPLEVAGLYQINCIVPAGVASGPATVTVVADGRPSQTNLTVSIR